MSKKDNYLWLNNIALMALIWVLHGMVSCSHSKSIVFDNNFDNIELNSFLEKEFPFISTYIDARNLGKNFPDDNVVSRGMIINLGDSAFACFDRDLLRWSVAWTGEHLTNGMLPQVSYIDYFNQVASEPLVAGLPQFANGMYPGGRTVSPATTDLRPEYQRVEGMSWGPLPKDIGRWKGSYVYNGKVILSYLLSDIEVFEFPGYFKKGGDSFFSRTFELGSARDTLFINAVEVRNAEEIANHGNVGYVYLGENKDSVLAVGVADKAASIRVIDNRFLSIAVPPLDQVRNLNVLIWKGRAENISEFNAVLNSLDIQIPPFRDGGNNIWPGEVKTKGKTAPDTAAFVTDLLTLPLPNPWGRNVRVTDLAFLNEETAFITTFEGDVWRVDGIDGPLKRLSWKRFASGLYEPMSVEVYQGKVYVFGKEGIVRLHDLNGDSEADYYENFCDLMNQSPESYAWASDMVFSDLHKSIFIAKGGAIATRAGITKKAYPGFRAGSIHDGKIMKISLDGENMEVYASGFRTPFFDINSHTGVITATDQQGNFVPSTPIYTVKNGDFFGVPATAHRKDNSDIAAPLTWIPHRVDRSAGSPVWITNGRMGPLNNSLVHLSFGKPGLFKVLIDSTAQEPQGGVTPINSAYPAPVLKGTMSPADGMLYLSGFNLFGSNSKGISAIQRLRYTGMKAKMLEGFTIGTQGMVLSFDTELDIKTANDSTNYQIKRWNYKRTKEYGSGHFRFDGTAGEEIMPVIGAHLSEDKRKVFLMIPDMKEIDQMEIMFDLKSLNGKSLNSGLWFSVRFMKDLTSALKEFPDVDLKRLNMSAEEIAKLIKYDFPITREKGKELFSTKGCIGCHSPGTETAGMYGPPFKGLYESSREMINGEMIEADDVYLKESILEPGKRVVKGYEAEMPSFLGVLSDSEIEAIILYIQYLKH